MSVATSIPCLRVPGPTTSASSVAPSSSSNAPSTSCCFRLAAGSRNHYTIAVMNSQAEGPLRRPLAPPPLTPPSPPSPLKPVAPSPPPPPPQPSGPVAQVVAGGKGVVTMEFQRQKAKEIQEYFKQKKLEEANQGPFFGFLGKNEIANGRWAMFGFAVGMLTEYATGSDFVDQVKILLSNFGILDLE